MTAFKSKAQQALVMAKLRKEGMLAKDEKVIAHEQTSNYDRYRVKSPKLFQSNSFRTIDPGKKGGTKFVVGKLKNQKTMSRQSILVKRRKR